MVVRLGQGLIFSGDAYTARFDKVTQDFTNVVRCINDSLIWADNVKDMFDSTCRYISVCAKGGIKFNKKIFRFSQDEVEYVGFKITKDAIIPADSMTEAIRNFPQPKNISDARAFFGLVKQVSFSFSKCDDMKAFRHLLSPKVKFEWTEELSREVALSKENIIKKIIEG